MKAITVLLITLATSVAACSSGNNSGSAASHTDSQSAAPVPSYDRTLARGVVKDSLSCLKQVDNSYALFLPSYYTSDKAYPCIFFFDAHGRGALPLKLYQSLAEKYGFVFAGSDISKNGMQWDITNEIVKTMMAGIRTRVNIDPNRIYTSGFSGGSRVASSVAIFDGGIAGVIGCAAGFPAGVQSIPHAFDYFGMAGNSDFNLTDMKALDKTLEQNGFRHQLLPFNGKHDWPPLACFRTSMLWMQACAMKKDLQAKNDTLISELVIDYKQRVTEVAKPGSLVEEYELLKGLVQAIGGLSDMSVFEKQLSALGATAAYRSEAAAEEQRLPQEANMQQELAKEFTSQDEQWWTKKIAALNKDIHTAKSQKESQMDQRLMNFTGLLGYLNADHAIKAGDLDHAAVYLRIFKMADPKNADCSYLSAIYYSRKGDKRQTLASLSEAATLGFSDVSLLDGAPAFNDLHNEALYKQALEKVRKNTRSVELEK